MNTMSTQSGCPLATTHTCVFVDAAGGRVCVSEQFSAELHKRLIIYLDAILALEAKVQSDEQTMRAMDVRWEATIADRDRLAAEVERWQRDVADAYGWLWCVNEEPGTPHRFPAERAAYNARKLLREALTHEQRGIGINNAVIQRDAARRAGEEPPR